jgi:hypothetical protein
MKRHTYCKKGRARYAWARAASHPVLFLLLLSAMVPRTVFAESAVEDKEGVSYKLTPSYYVLSDGNAAEDLNLRANRGPNAAWIGQYRDHAGFQQTRFGYEYTQDTGALHIVWSAQAATRGFLGGSVTAQFGDNIYPVVAFGRTNLRPYNNLNFDPNDMATLGFGTKLIPNIELSVTHLWDNRLDTGQHVTHVYFHRHLSKQRRLSFDLSYKHGINSESAYVAGSALTVTYAWANYFIRGAYDQYANFGPMNQFRFSVGYGF